MGARTEQRPVASGRVPPAARARVRARALGVLVRPARLARQPADRAARARGQPLLRARLHALAEALDAAEHRHRRRRRRRAAARRLRGRRGPPRLGRARHVRRRLRLDAAALLGARADDQGALRARRRADAAGRRAATRRRRAQIVLYTVAARRRRRSCRSRSASSGSSYGVAALVLGAVFAWYALELRRDAGARSRAVRLFHYSLLYLALLFVAMAADPVSLMAEPLPEPSRPRRSSTPPRASGSWRGRTSSGAGRSSASSRALRGHGADRARLPLARLRSCGPAPAPSKRRAARPTIRRRTRLDHRARRRAAGGRLAVKDLFDTAGVRTTYGSAVFADHVPGDDGRGGRACSRRPGWSNVGKTNLHEFAYGVTSQNLHYGVGPEPVAPGPHRGRVERRLGGGARARARRRRARHRHGRLDPHPGRVLRRRRLQADVRRRADRRRLPARARRSTTPARWRATSRAASS